MLAALLGGVLLARQPPAQEQRPIFRGGANAVRVDVTVTSRRGDPATDLTRDDFELAEDGVPQAIDSFMLVRADGQPTDDRSLPIRSREHAAAEAARDDVRLFLIFWDEYHIGEFIPATRGRDALTEFVLNAFGPTDLVAIMDQLTTVDSIRFTRDRRDLANQVHALKGRLGVLMPPRSVMEEGHLRFPREIGRLRNEVTMSALMSAAAYLGNFREGRKALLFVSQGIPQFGPSGEAERFREIVRVANTNNTAIYTLDPAAEVGRRPASLLALAYETGGRPIVGTNRPALLLPQIVRDSSAYYLLGYTSPAPVDGKFHKIDVRVKKDGYEVRARSGYFAPTVGELTRGRAAAAAAAAIPPDVERAFGELAAVTRADRVVDLWLGMARGEAGRTRVTVAWEPRAAGAVAGVSIVATGPDGTKYAEHARTTERAVSFDAPPGDLILATTAFDRAGQEVDGDMRRVPVAAFDDERLAIGTPRVLSARIPLEARTLAAGGEIPVAARRTFDRTERLFIRFPVYGGAGTATTAHLLNRQGAVMRALTVEQVPERPAQVDLPLSVTARGDYLVALEARRGEASTRVLVPIRVR